VINGCLKTPCSPFFSVRFLACLNSSSLSENFFEFTEYIIKGTLLNIEKMTKFSRQLRALHGDVH
jgi:hypothetical protein